MKRNSELVVDAISGGDIGALPDVTIAETLVRLPGVNGTRDRGNQSQATLRGLGPRLVLGLVNGREVASSEPNRNVRWEIYPSEVVSGVDVYKSQSADIVAGGVAGTIDIRTIRPLELLRARRCCCAAAPVWYEARHRHSPTTTRYGYRGSGSFTKRRRQLRLQHRRRAAQKQKNGYQSFQGWGFNDGTINPGNATGDLNGDGTPDPTPWGAQTEVKKLDQDRFGVNAALGWRVGDNGEINFDALYSKFKIDEDQNQAWYGRNGTTGNWANGSAGCYNGAGVQLHARDDVVVAATLDNCFTSVTNVIAQYTEDKDLLVTGLNGELRLGAWKFVGDLSHSNAAAHEPVGRVLHRGLSGDDPFDMSCGRQALARAERRARIRPIRRIQSSPELGAGTKATAPTISRTNSSAGRLDLTREFEGAHSSRSRSACAVRAREGLLPRQEFFAPITATLLPAQHVLELHGSAEFDVPPLLNGNFSDLVEAAYGGMPVNPDAIVRAARGTSKNRCSRPTSRCVSKRSVGSIAFNGNVGVRVVQHRNHEHGLRIGERRRVRSRSTSTTTTPKCCRA